MNPTSSSLLLCSKLLLYAKLRYSVLHYESLLSSSPCSSVVLHQVIKTEREGYWVSYELCSVCVCVSLRTNVMSVLCRHCPTQQLALPPLALLHIPSCLFSSTSHLSVTHECVFLVFCVTYFHLIPLFQLLRTSQRHSACSSWISANGVLPAQSCISPLLFPLSYPSLPPPLLAFWHVT